MNGLFLVANAHRGKRLMEVVITGDLSKASSGKGFRGYSMGPKGIEEQATLFEIRNLPKLVNAAAIWQLASMVVAQKHMADINDKLPEIATGLHDIQAFLESGRRSEIMGVYDYLNQAAEAARGGEFSSAVRDKLEDCERALLTIEKHLLDELRRRCLDPAKHTDMSDRRS